MVLTNKMNLIRAVKKMYDTNASSSSTHIDISDFPAVDIDGTSRSDMSGFYSGADTSRYQAYQLASAIFSGYEYTVNSIRFGSSDTPVSASDYSISTVLSVNVNHSSGFNVLSDGTVRLYGSITNDTGADIVIKEVGRTIRVYNLAQKEFLIERTVLPNPITLHPSDVYSFTYDIKPGV